MSERRVVRSLDIGSVVRVAFGLSLSVWGIAFVGLIALYILGLVSGGLGGVEGFIASLGFTGFRLSILPFLGVFIVAAAIGSALVAVVAGVLAYLYNALYPLVGGITFTADEQVERREPVVRTYPPEQVSSPQPPAPPLRRPGD